MVKHKEIMRKEGLVFHNLAKTIIIGEGAPK